MIVVSDIVDSEDMRHPAPPHFTSSRPGWANEKSCGLTRRDCFGNWDGDVRPWIIFDRTGIQANIEAISDSVSEGYDLPVQNPTQGKYK